MQGALPTIRWPRPMAGFTIIELMVSVTILAILMGIGVPMFTDVIRNSRAASQTNELVTSLNLARSEASKRGLPVSICAANAGQTACAGGTNTWTNGWVVFTDQGTTPGTLQTGVGEEILEVSPPLGAQMSLTSDSNTGFIRFGATGARVDPSTANTLVRLWVKHADCTDLNRRELAISNVGRISLSKVTCT